MKARRNPVRWALALALVGGLAAPAEAQSPEALRYELVPTTALGGTLVVGTVLSLTVLDPPANCSWCDPGTPDDVLAPALFAQEDRETIALVSDIGQYTAWMAGLGIGFAGGFLEAGRGRLGAEHGAQNAWAVTEAVLATHLLTTTVKHVVARRRPARSLGFMAHDVHENTSFFSGHSAQTSTVAASTSTIAFMRGYSWAPAAAVGLGTVALTTALFRVISGRHWPSDVLVGLLVGAAVGVAMPLVLHPRLDRASN